MTAQSAQQQYVAHVTVCPVAERGSWDCQDCLWLDADARAEDWQRTLERITARRCAEERGVRVSAGAR